MIFEKANSFLLTDTIANLQRIETLIARLDQPFLEGMTPKFYKVVNSSAGTLVTKLQNLLSGNAAAPLGTNTVYLADDRTNQIVLLSDARQHPFFDQLIAKLDSPGDSSTRQEVIPLKHATATDVATLLGSLISGQNAVNSRNGGTSSTRSAPAGSGRLANPATNTANRPAGAPQTAPAVIAQLPGAGNEASQQFSDILTVVPDERSNALVVSGTVEDLRLIKDIVAGLDVLLAQVRIEVVIAEITLGDSSTTGIDALGLVISGNKLVAFNGSGPGGSIAGPPDTTSGTPGPFATITGNDLAATLNLRTTPRKSNTNILPFPTSSPPTTRRPRSSWANLAR